MKENIALIGFMGSGKTTVGKLLADRISFMFIDLDRVIELSEGRPIKDIFREEGEDYFRKIESKVIRKIINNKKCVFACGGGAVLKGENMKQIKKNCEVVYLMISPEEAFKRLSESRERPLLKIKERKSSIDDLLKGRQNLYLRYAAVTLDNNNIAPEDAVGILIKRLKIRDYSTIHAYNKG